MNKLLERALEDLAHEKPVSNEVLLHLLYRLEAYEATGFTPEQLNLSSQMVTPVSIKDFKPGEKAWVLYESRGSQSNREIKPVTIESVGRKYVTCGFTRYEKSDTFPYGFPAKDRFVLYANILFPTEQQAIDYTHMDDVKRKHSDIFRRNLYLTPNQTNMLEKLLNQLV